MSKRKLFAASNEEANEIEFGNFASMEASPKKQPREDIVIHGKSSARRIPNTEKLEDTAWIRENHNVKTLLYFLDECSSILRKYNPVLTGSTAILVYLITGYQSGKLKHAEFKSMLKSLKPINDIEAVFDGIVKTKDFHDADFEPQLKNSNKLPDVLLEANGITFVKHTVSLDPKSYEAVDKPIKIKVIIDKQGKKRVEADDNIIEREIELPMKKINVRIYHPRTLSSS